MCECKHTDAERKHLGLIASILLKKLEKIKPETKMQKAILDNIEKGIPVRN